MENQKIETNLETDAEGKPVITQKLIVGGMVFEKKIVIDKKEIEVYIRNKDGKLEKQK